MSSPTPNAPEPMPVNVTTFTGSQMPHANPSLMLDTAPTPAMKRYAITAAESANRATSTSRGRPTIRPPIGMAFDWALMAALPSPSPAPAPPAPPPAARGARSAG